MQKINAANEMTGFNQTGYPKGGMGALSYVVQKDLGIPVDYYGLMDYGAFKDSVDAVGGVRIDIQSPDPRGLYDPNTDVNLPNGWVNLNGQQALNLARARGDGYGSYGFPNSDFDRTEHQRQLFIAVAQKAESIGVLSNPDKISNLFDALGNNFQTNLNLSDVLALIRLTKNINPSTIQSYSYCSTLSIGQNGCTTPILTDYTDPSSGAEALVPEAGISNYSQMELYYEQLTSNNPVVKENATAVVLNGGNTDGLAKLYENALIPKGINVTSIADSSTTYPTTEIMDDSGGKDPAARQVLESMFGSDIVPNNPSVNTTSANFVVILGVNQGPPS
jgi:LCP family protein required for cell wall assembly